MTEAVAYYRVSTIQQDLERQKSKVREYAASHNYRITKELEDKITGHDPNRPAFIHLKEWIPQHPGSTILIAELDRAARDLAAYAELRKISNLHNVTIHFLNVPSTGNLEVDKMVEGFMALLAEYESSLIKTRMMGGKLIKLKEGNPIVSRVPYGYTYIRRDPDTKRAAIVVNDDEATIVKKIFEYYVKKKYSLHKIAIQLTQDGVPTQKRARAWQRSTLRGILTQSAYYGELWYGKNESIDFMTRKTRKRDKSEWILIPTPAIIDKSTFDKAQEIVKLNIIRNPRFTKYEYLLSALLECGKCHKLYSAFRTNYGGRFYRCRSRDILDEKGNRTYCHNRMVKADDIEPHVWMWVKYFVTHPDLVKERYAAFEQEAKSTIDELKKRIDQLNSRITMLTTKEDEFLMLYNQDKVDIATWSKHKEITDTQREGYQKELQENLEKLTPLEDSTGQSYELSLVKLSIHKLTADDLDHLPFIRRQELTRRFIKKVIILPERGKFIIEFTLPFVKRAKLNTLKGIGPQYTTPQQHVPTTYTLTLIREVDFNRSPVVYAL